MADVQSQSYDLLFTQQSYIYMLLFHVYIQHYIQALINLFSVVPIGPLRSEGEIKQINICFFYMSVINMSKLSCRMKWET
jgi:hypothetical protein